MKLKQYKKDIIIIGLILFVAIVLVALIDLLKQPGEYVVVNKNQEEIGRYLLSEDNEIKIIIDEDNYNILVIKDNKAYIKDATCPDHICVKHAKISKTGETITCLPNKLVIKIEGQNQEVDVMS